MKKCSTCDNCKIVYTKIGVRFWRGKERYCSKYNKLVKKNYDCANWHEKIVEYDVSVERLDSVVEDIGVMINLFE